MSHAYKKILVSWVARSNDPYEWDAKNARVPVNEANHPIYGPTLTLLLDQQSEYQDIRKAFFFYRTASDAEALNGIRSVLKKQRPNFQFEALPWEGNDPTDHKALFNYMQPELKRIREHHPDDELVINVSPGTPAMHTVWVLLAEVGYIRQPVTLVQCHRSRERNGCPPVERISIGVENYFKQYQDTMSCLNEQSDSTVSWNPLDFRSEKLKALEREARRFAKVKTPVLILGERGTGKSTWAVWIRSNSPYRRLKKNWVGVACGQFTSDLMRSELFGHVKGAFTGAEKDKTGLLKRMDNDTLFLDEIGSLSLASQPRLLRVLETGEYRRLGDPHPHSAQFRLVSASCINPIDLAAKNKFRSDLVYRIADLVIEIPPLRHRAEDIPLLANRFIEKYSAIHGKKLNGFTDKAMRAILAYPWPGNIRELLNMVERGVILAPNGTRIEQEQMFSSSSTDPAMEFGLDSNGSLGVGHGETGKDVYDEVLNGRMTLNQAEAMLIEAAVKKANGNLSAAARVLGLTRPQLAYRLGRLHDNGSEIGGQG